MKTKEHVYSALSAVVGFCVGYGAPVGIDGHTRTAIACLSLAILALLVRQILGRKIMVNQIRLALTQKE